MLALGPGLGIYTDKHQRDQLARQRTITDGTVPAGQRMAG
jgi:hypothetical protein